MNYTHEHTARATDPRLSGPLPAAYDEKEDLGLLRQKLAQRKKPIYAGLAFLCLVVIGVSIAVASGGATEASTQSAQVEPTPQQQEQVATQPPAPALEEAAVVRPADDDVSAASSAGSSQSGSASASSSGSAVGEVGLEAEIEAKNASSVPTATPPTEAPTPAPTDGPLLPYREIAFDWRNPANWEYANGNGVPPDMFANGEIRLTSGNSPTPIRTKMGWGGEKIVFIEWERSEASDTNIWMLNTKLYNQFGKGNGWPYWGELDIFEMFTQDARDKGYYDFSGFGQFNQVASYGQLTLHMGPRKEDGPPCFCPASPAKSRWYKDSHPMTSGCTAQFANSPKNAIATIFGRDGSGQFLQLMQYPTVTKGGKTPDGVQTWDVAAGGGPVTPPILNNAELFWGMPSSAVCAKAGGHNPATGFPFFEDFFITLEEQMKGDPNAWFKITNIQIFVKN